MSEKKVLLRFHLGNERERKAWEHLLQRKQQGRCSYGDIVMDALLANEDHATEISAEQEDQIVGRIKVALASCTTQPAQTVASGSSASVPAVADEVVLPMKSTATPSSIGISPEARTIRCYQNDSKIAK